MSCTNCYTTNSATPCGTVGCLSTNYSKCIIYSGNNLYCQTGTIETVNFSGVAVSPVSDTTVTVSCTGGTGSGATFSVTRLAGFTTYTVSIVNKGLGYTVGDVLTILGTSLGGTSSNNILVVVSGLTPIISNSDSIDEIILNLHQRLCLTSTAGLDYSTFNYSCLRVGGNLTGVGTTITTAQQFTEATAAALCALNTRVLAVEKPAILVPSCFTSNLTSGTSTLVNILDLYGGFICTLNINTNLSAVNGNPCLGYAFTTKPVNQVVLSDYINWITTNMCGMFTTNNGLILAQTAKVNALYTYITGSTSGSVPASVDTSCLSGGSLTSSLKDAIVLIKNNLCSLNTTVAGLGGATNLTVSWSGCFTSPYTANSIFNVQSLGSFTNTTNLQTHLNQIASALSALNIKFDSTYFTVTNSSCGPVVSLASSSSFSCSSLSTCSINALADVDTTGVATGDTLKWNGTNFVPSSSTPTSANLVSAIAPSSWSLPLSWSNASLGGTIITVYPEVSKLNRLVILGQTTLVKLTATSTYPSITAGTQITLFTIPSGFTPLSSTGNQYISGTIMKVDSTTLIVATYPVMYTIMYTGQILMTFLSSPTPPASTDYFILPMGGMSWFS